MLQYYDRSHELRGRQKPPAFNPRILKMEGISNVVALEAWRKPTSDYLSGFTLRKQMDDAWFAPEGTKYRMP
jgi:hypothetical protein